MAESLRTAILNGARETTTASEWRELLTKMVDADLELQKKQASFAETKFMVESIGSMIFKLLENEHVGRFLQDILPIILQNLGKLNFKADDALQQVSHAIVQMNTEKKTHESPKAGVEKLPEKPSFAEKALIKCENKTTDESEERQSALKTRIFFADNGDTPAETYMAADGTFNVRILIDGPEHRISNAYPCIFSNIIIPEGCKKMLLKLVRELTPITPYLDEKTHSATIADCVAMRPIEHWMWYLVVSPTPDAPLLPILPIMDVPVGATQLMLRLVV